MPIIVNEGGGQKVYTPHPEGTFAATCVDALDLGWKESPWGLKYRVGLVFYCGKSEKNEEGESFPLTVASFFNASFNEKATLRKFVSQWKGSKFKLPNNDLEQLIGDDALITVEHNEHNGKTYANITSQMGLPDGTSAPGIPEDFVRLCNREDWEGPAPHPEMSKPQEKFDEKLPWED